jgi:hypothetical protein
MHAAASSSGSHGTRPTTAAASCRRQRPGPAPVTGSRPGPSPPGPVAVSPLSPTGPLDRARRAWGTADRGPTPSALSPPPGPLDRGSAEGRPPLSLASPRPVRPGDRGEGRRRVGGRRPSGVADLIYTVCFKLCGTRAGSLNRPQCSSLPRSPGRPPPGVLRPFGGRGNRATRQRVSRPGRAGLPQQPAPLSFAALGLVSQADPGRLHHGPTLGRW